MKKTNYRKQPQSVSRITFYITRIDKEINSSLLN